MSEVNKSKSNCTVDIQTNQPTHWNWCCHAHEDEYDIVWYSDELSDYSSDGELDLTVDFDESILDNPSFLPYW